MPSCDRCEASFEEEDAYYRHLGAAHPDDLNTHEAEKAERAQQRYEERQAQRSRDRGARLQRYAVYGGVAVLAVVVVGLLVMQADLSGSGTPTGKVAAERSFSTAGEPVRGAADAPVTVVLFEDFQCPACRAFEQRVYPVLEPYVEEGAVKVVWKDFPLERVADMHPWSMEAAVAMECVYRQDAEAFWAVKSTVFARQAGLTEGTVQDRIVSWAGEEGVDTAAVRACLEDGAAAAEVREDVAEGRSNGVEGTPRVYVDGRLVTGGTFDAMRRNLEQAVQRAQ